MSDRWSDEELFARLAEALREADNVPQEFISMGKSVYTLRDIDAELAELTYDSARGDDAYTTLARADTASLRNLTFSASLLKIELEVTADALHGQLVPPQAGEVTIQTTMSKWPSTLPIDDVGCFTIRPGPVGYFRLHCRTSSDHRVSTDWIALSIPPER